MKASFLAVVCLVWITSASGTELSIGGLQVRLGMEKAAILSEAKSRFHVVPVSGLDQIMLSQGKPPNASFVGSVSFAGGKVAEASRTWGHFGRPEDPTEVGKAMFAAIESVSRSTGIQQPSVSTEVHRVPAGEFKTVKLTYGNRYVSITSVEATPANGGRSVQITEVIK